MTEVRTVIREREVPREPPPWWKRLLKRIVVVGVVLYLVQVVYTVAVEPEKAAPRMCRAPYVVYRAALMSWATVVEYDSPAAKPEAAQSARRFYLGCVAAVREQTDGIVMPVHRFLASLRNAF